MGIKSKILPYSMAIGSTVIALLFTLLLEAQLPQSLTVFFFIAVTISSWYGGFRAGLVAAILSTLLFSYFFVAPVGNWSSSQIGDFIRLLCFCSVSLVIDRKKVQNTSQQSEQRYRALVHASSQIVWRTDALGNVTTTPHGWEELTGQSAAECLGWGWLDVVHPDDRSDAAFRWQESYANPSLYETEYRLRMKNGNYRDFTGRGVPIMDADGKISEWIGTCTDITEHKQTLSALRENQILLQRQLAEIEIIYQSAPIGLSVLDTELRFVRINQLLAEINGLPVEAHIGRTVGELLPALADTAQQLLRSILETGEPLLNVEITGETPAQPGVLRTWVESFLPLKDGERIIGISTVCEEITERKLTEAERIQLLHQEQVARKQVEHLLGQIEADRNRLEQILQQMPVGVMIAEVPSGKLLYHNDEAVRLLRHPFLESDSYHEYTQYRAVHASGQPYQPHEYPLVRSLLSGKTIKAEEMHYIRGDGTMTLLEVSAAPILDSQAQIIAAVATFEDISSRKQAQETLRQNQTRLHLAQVGSNCAVWDWDIRTNKIFWAPEFYKLYGLDPNTEANYDNWLNCIHPDDREQTNQATLRALEGRNTDFFVQFRVIRNNEVQWFAGIAQVFRDTAFEALRMTGITIDITQQKQTEIALQQLNASLEQRVQERTAELISVNQRLSHSEEKFRQLAENIQDVFWITDIASEQVIYASPAYETLWGRNLSLLYKHFNEWLDAIHPSDRSRVEQTFQDKALQGYYDHEYRIVRPDGSIRWIRDRAFPIKNEAGDIIRLAGIAEDITERQRVEEIKNEFISVVSHELRTPLMAIQMSLGLLKTGIYANKPEKAQRMVEIASIDTNRLVNLVNDILDLERLESGRTVLEMTLCQTYELMQQAVDGVQALASGQNISLIIAPTIGTVWAAGDTIVQTLTNLLSNAIKFSPASSVIHLGAEQQVDHVLFHVSDSGRGIPADKLEAIFGRFQQVDASDARSKGGTGLGLSICRSIIERHGGKIWAESTLGTGSTFFFTLPIPLDDDL